MDSTFFLNSFLCLIILLNSNLTDFGVKNVMNSLLDLRSLSNNAKIYGEVLASFNALPASSCEGNFKIANFTEYVSNGA